MKNILVVNVNWLGDVIFSTPIFKALKEKYPQARIFCLAVPRVKEILESNSYLDEVIEYDERGKHFSPWGKFKLIHDLRRRRFDIAFLLHRSWTRALLVYLAGIPQRVGYDAKKRGGFLTHKVRLAAEPLHRSDHYLRVIEDFGVTVKDRTNFLSIDRTARSDIEKMLTQHGVSPSDFLVALNTGGNWDLKRWPKSYFVQLMEYLSVHSSWKIVVPGSSQDQSDVQEMIALSRKQVINLAGKTNLKQLIALLARVDVAVSADSGPLHMANAVGTPVVGIFGPTRPELTGPRGSGEKKFLQKDVGCNRAPCYYLDCPSNVCMQAVSVEEVFNAVQEIYTVHRKK